MFSFWKKKKKKEKTEGSAGSSDTVDCACDAASVDPGQDAESHHGHSHEAGAVLAIPTRAGLITPAHPIPVAVIPAAAAIKQENLFNA